MSEYTLLTGATGLLGSFLMRDLLASNQPLAVLVRPTKTQTAAERIESVLLKWEAWLGHSLARPVYLEGDVNRPHLGFDLKTRRWVAKNCRRVIHNAAVLKFSGQDRMEDPWRTNVGGTRRTLELCQKVGLRDFHYISTAYVCGKRDSEIQEGDLEAEQQFRNDYEQSKYLAERLLRDNEFLDPPTVYRPVVIAGDSQTGMTTTYHGIYVYLRLLSTLLKSVSPDSDGRRHAPLRIALEGSERHNLVPVDWVSEVICHLIETPAAYGQTFHLAPREPITVRGCYEAAYRFYNCYGFEFCGKGWKPDSDLTPFEKAFLAHGQRYQDYERTDPVFNTKNLNHYASHLPCPEIDDLVIGRYCAYGQQNAWAKHRWQSPVTSVWAEELLESTLAGIQRQQWLGFLNRLGIDELVFGADILGPGGGQWKIQIDQLRSPTMTAGLPSEGEPILRLTTDRLSQLLGLNPVQDLKLVSESSSSGILALNSQRGSRLIQLAGAQLAQHAWVAMRRRASAKKIAS